MTLRNTLLLASLLLSPGAQAQEPAAPAEDPAAALLAALRPQSGEVALPGGLAALKLTETFRYLTPADTRRVIEEGWGNPPGSGDGTLGMIVPAAVNPLSPTGWGVIISYVDDGHVSDEDASEIDYAALLKEMQEQTAAGNEERIKAGFGAVTLHAWAEPPHYDAASKKIYWAKDLSFGDGPDHTLNYAIRVLGRQGVLELNAVAGMSQLQQVREDMKQVVSFAEFTQNNRYADFNADTDKVAAYGLAALVAGGVAAKTGLFAKLLALVLAFKKLLIVAAVAAVGLLAKLFGRKAPATGGSAGPNPT